ncbi:glycosyltransferase [Streptomyces sp. NPDC087270]|uniref:glycosyltransferase n=1 Tax=Streptomyces sp. NPDC087270 TaxID=3365774 RepID=UPI00382FE2E8
MSLQVTVIVPTYNTGALIEPLIAALKSQTMARADFEVLFVDDGSTDSTPDRLEELAAADPLFRVVRLENTGWPGHPRNVAVDMARGEYVQFVDHDDSLGPEALERMYAAGRRNGSDIVIGKVTITHRLRGAPQALMSRNRESVTYRTAPLHDSLTVHKMYRTAFLREQGIRFPVGHYVGEDLLFMVPAVLRAASVSIVGDYPCYYYLEREDGGHATPDRLDPDSYAGNLREIFDALLAETEPGPVRDTWLRRFWRADMVKYLSEPIFPAYPDGDYRDRLVEALRSVAADYLTPAVHDGLVGLERVRADLVRAARTADLLTLARRADTLRADATLTGASFHRERLRLEFEASFGYGDEGTALTVERRDGRYLLDPRLTEGLGLEPGLEPVDLTDHLTRFRVDVLLRHRGTAVKWMLPRDVEVVWQELPPRADGVERLRPVIRATATVDPRRAAGGSPPDAGAWEVQVRVLGPGLDRTTDLTAPAGGPAVPTAAVGGLRVGAAPEESGARGAAGAPGGGGADGGGAAAAVVLLVEPGHEPALPAGPRVSVIVRAGDDAGQVAASLASVAAQDWAEGAVETLVAARPTDAVPEPPPAGVRVVRTGADPRDTAAAEARGAYLLFLRAGDRLAPEALRRLYAYGLEHDADVVAGRLAGAKGRPVPQELYARDRPDAKLSRDPLGDSLTTDKLFDTAMVRRHGLRFGSSAAPFDDQAFTVAALLRARRTAVLGSYVCCSYAPARKPAGAAPATPAMPTTPAAYYAGLREVMAAADALTAPGAARDRLHRRWLRVEVLDRIGGARLLDADEAERAALLAEIRRTLEESASATAAEGLPAHQRLTLALVRAGRTEDLVELVRWERSLACLPTLLDVAWRADGTLAVTFTATLAADGRPVELVPGQERLAPSGVSPELHQAFGERELTGAACAERARATLVLRERETGARYPLETDCTVERVSAGAGGDGGDVGNGANGGDGGDVGVETVTVSGTAVLDPASVVSGRPLADGAWDFHVRLAALGWTKTARLGGRRAPELVSPPAARPHPAGGERTVQPYWTKGGEDLSLRVGRGAPPSAGPASGGRTPLGGLVRRLRGRKG